MYLCLFCVQHYFFSSIYPVGDYFFLLKIADYSKDYHPESKIIMDIPAALNFFLKDPQFTRNLIKTKVDQLASAWNKKFYQTDATVYLSVSHLIYYFLLYMYVIISNLFIYFYRLDTQDPTIRTTRSFPLMCLSKRETMSKKIIHRKLCCPSITGIS